MSSKEELLRAVRRHELPESPLPSLDQDWIQYEDRQAQFIATLESVGGRAQVVANTAELNSALAELPAFRDAKRVCSLVEGVGDGNVDLARISEPHELADVDLAIFAAEFGIAENGAVWVTDEHIRHRAIFFLPQHIAVVLSASQLFDNMYQAYQRLSWETTHFGLFVSGPSKTADIEQSLVIGAHGARSLTLFLVSSPSDQPA